MSAAVLVTSARLGGDAARAAVRDACERRGRVWGRDGFKRVAPYSESEVLDLDSGRTRRHSQQSGVVVDKCYARGQD